jgi:hypothetical protein
MTNRNKVTANNGAKERKKSWTQFVIVYEIENYIDDKNVQNRKHIF